jgi:glycosyltransferase involved in cell wall biosynthesis
LKIIVASTYAPFVRGGDRVLVESLVRALYARGHEVETVLVPFRSYWLDLREQTLALRSLDLILGGTRCADRLITIRYPSFAIRHPNKVVWFIHHHRGAYDLWGTPWQDIPNTQEGERFRDALVRSDTLYLREARRVFTISQTLVERLKRGNGIVADGVLYPPLPNPELFYAGDYGQYFLYVARLAPLKRQDLAIQAMRYVTSTFNLILVGSGESNAYVEKLKALIARYQLGDRVKLLGWVSEEEKASLTANAYAVLNIPYDEDSPSFSTLEAFQAAKPVVTCQDSGGTTELVAHDVNGLVLPSDARALAEGLDQLWADRAQTRRLGGNARETLRRHDIGWDRVIEGLLG